ncbi:mannitol 1-phosphate dehydrogenase protein [Diplodia corticola]|uniref:Mannitol 1-phosphate dehydrogenase protein n=1 Tax=Diplodia corticola TaxID=236234 RepID=A0A1J9RHJ5_9PEZI|nr:mannitol 1-phosphate dehydrogenase protein [Diplodia corticola]OJD32019.1 mannitol 1-phosphate dehydrogenase protein [Diplodia corticola]
MASPKPFTVAIVGGGLGGVVLAIGLLAQRVPVHIYEAAKGFGEIGAGVAFGPNSVLSLGLVSPALLQAYAKHATCNAAASLQSTFVSVRYGMQSPTAREAVDGGEPGEPGEWCFDVKTHGRGPTPTGFPARCCVHRAKFLEEIIQLVPEGTASFGKSLANIDELTAEGGGVHLHFSDGTSATASAVVGCDGIKSKARSFVHGPDAQPVFTGDYAYRAMVPSDAFEKAMGPELTFNGQLYVGHGGYIITYPVEHGRLINVVASRCKPGSTWGHGSWLLPSTEEEIRSELRGWHPRLVGLLSAYSAKEKWALFDYPHQKQYCRGPVCLLGDAAHAAAPHLGAGAGQAMEDAYVLSRLLGKAEKADDLPSVFQAYDAVRRPRTQQIVQWSRLSGRALAFLEEGVGDDCARIEDVSNQRFRAVWDEDVERELQQAIALCT